jgi:hypothetical protein
MTELDDAAMERHRLDQIVWLTGMSSFNDHDAVLKSIAILEPRDNSLPSVAVNSMNVHLEDGQLLMGMALRGIGSTALIGNDSDLPCFEALIEHYRITI